MWQNQPLHTTFGKWQYLDCRYRGRNCSFMGCGESRSVCSSWDKLDLLVFPTRLRPQWRIDVSFWNWGISSGRCHTQSPAISGTRICRYCSSDWWLNMLCIIAMYYNFHKEKKCIFILYIFNVDLFICMLLFPNMIENFYTLLFILQSRLSLVHKVKVIL